MDRGLRRFRLLAAATACATLVLTGIGGLVRATGSGLGCQDEWPRCAGGWIAPANAHAIIEYTHRVVAALVVVLVVGMVGAAVRWVRRDRTLLVLCLAALVLVVFQAALGALVVGSRLHAATVSAHFVAALGLVAATTWTAARALVLDHPRASLRHRPVARMALGALVALLPLLVVGTLVREKGAGLAFTDWPLMSGRLVPSFRPPGAALHFLHRLLALLVAGHLVTTWLRARQDERGHVRSLASVGVGLYLAQALVGGANVLTKLHPAAVVAHEALAYLTWSAFVALAVVGGREQPSAAGAPPPPPSPGIAGRVLAYARLTKPRIVVLLLVTTVPAMVLADRGLPPLSLVAATLVGGMACAGSANAFNQLLERDIDEKMRRTRGRPLPSHAVSPRGALVFATALGATGFLELAVTVNLVAAALAASAIVFYVLVYTVLLKRTTPQNIVIGGAAGAVPVLVGWAAVTGRVGAPAWVMFAIVFLWTPPHFWALAMRYRDDYAAAGVPMLPVVRSASETTTRILGYTVVLVLATLVLLAVGGLGPLYALTSAALGGWFVYRAARLYRTPDPETAFKLFRYSVTYLGLLFAAIAVDRLVW